MMVLSKDLVKKSEENAVNNGLFSFKELMHKAGKSAFDIINKDFEIKNKNILVVCGNGNNGGDGCVIADLLSKNGAVVSVYIPFGIPKTDNARYYYNKLSNVKIVDEIKGEFDIIIDAIFGIGLNRKLSDDVIILIKKLNQINATRIAVDIPSGVEADTGEILGEAFDADLTITFIALKPCFLLPLGSDYCGNVMVSDIGVEPINALYQTIEEPNLPKRRHNSHKGTFGTALFFCGSYGMAGAAVFSTLAALKSGLGIAKCVVCDSIYSAFTTLVPEAVCVPVKQNEFGTLDIKNIDMQNVFKGTRALLFGCGTGNNNSILELLKYILNNYENPIVIDADGINAVALSIDIIRNTKAQIIMTPHPGEMARLMKVSVKEIEDNRVYYAKKFVAEYNCTLVLKGANTIVATKNGELFFNTNGNAGMAKGGSGDILAGVIVALISQNIPLVDAIKAAVFLHSKAGDNALEKFGERGILARNIIDEL